MEGVGVAELNVPRIFCAFHGPSPCWTTYLICIDFIITLNPWHRFPTACPNIDNKFWVCSKHKELDLYSGSQTNGCSYDFMTCVTGPLLLLLYTLGFFRRHVSTCNYRNFRNIWWDIIYHTPGQSIRPLFFS